MGVSPREKQACCVHAAIHAASVPRSQAGSWRSSSRRTSGDVCSSATSREGTWGGLTPAVVVRLAEKGRGPFAVTPEPIDSRSWAGLEERDSLLRGVHGAAMICPGSRNPPGLASRSMSPSLVVADCPECGGIQTVVLGSCCACLAEFGHRDELGPEGNEGDALSDRAPARTPILPQGDRREGLMRFTSCPVCGGRFRFVGPDGVLAHLTAVHPFSAESRWISRQLALLNPAAPELMNASGTPERCDQIGVTVIHAQPA